MSKEIFFLNEPVLFKTGIKVYPPTVHDVIVNENYGIYSRLLTYSQEEVEDEFLEAEMSNDDRDYLTALYTLKQKGFNMILI